MARSYNWLTSAIGVAACNIGGTTLHKFAGFGIGDLPVRELIAKIKKNRQAAQRWRTTRVLIIDEGKHRITNNAAYTNYAYFQCLCSTQICSTSCQRSGQTYEITPNLLGACKCVYMCSGKLWVFRYSVLQIIVTGDFFQLPPVKKSGPTKFAFEAEMWAETMKHTFNLTKVFRQHDQSAHFLTFYKNSNKNN